MKIENSVKIIKKIHTDKLVMVKNGPFYHTYGKDAILLSYIFNYNLRNVEGNSESGFPIAAINKVMENLEELNIDYITVNKSDNYEVEEEESYKSKNKYNEMYMRANKYINKKNRINEIYNYFLENIDDNNIKEKIVKVEEILYEI